MPYRIEATLQKIYPLDTDSYVVKHCFYKLRFKITWCLTFCNKFINS